jgi:hypothetical protein
LALGAPSYLQAKHLIGFERIIFIRIESGKKKDPFQTLQNHTEK